MWKVFVSLILTAFLLVSCDSVRFYNQTASEDYYIVGEYLWIPKTYYYYRIYPRYDVYYYSTPKHNDKQGKKETKKEK